jgi:hypothetical protein
MRPNLNYLRSIPGRPICKASRSIAEFTLASACYGSMPLKAAEVTPSMLVGVASAWRAYDSDGRSHLMIEAFRRVESIQASGEERQSGLICPQPI